MCMGIRWSCLSTTYYVHTHYDSTHQVEGELLELPGFHANGQIDISPLDLQQLRLTKLSVRAP